MTSSDYAAVLEPTDLPCPDWCGQPSGHGFDSEVSGGSGVLARWHEVSVGTIATRRPGSEGESGKVYVDLCSEELAASNAGPILPPGIAPHIVVDGESTHLSSGEARQLAAALLLAADALERL